LVGNQQAGYTESVAARTALDTEAIEQSLLQTDLDLDSTQRNQLKSISKSFGPQSARAREYSAGAVEKG